MEALEPTFCLGIGWIYIGATEAMLRLSETIQN